MIVKIGKTYEARNGAKIKIIKESDSHDWPFIGVDKSGEERSYARNGVWFFACTKNGEDLMREVPDK